jgi:hypothetical protein
VIPQAVKRIYYGFVDAHEDRGERVPTPSMVMLARVTGFLASGGIIILWMVLVFLSPYGSGGVTRGTYMVAGAMTLLALLGGAAVYKVKPYPLLGVFVASFVPVGFYMIGTPGIFKWIGVFNALFLVSGLLLLGNRRIRQ